jgi:hypothetical protein
VPPDAAPFIADGQEPIQVSSHSNECYPRSWTEYSNGVLHENSYDNRHQGPYHHDEPQGPYEPLLVPTPTIASDARFSNQNSSRFADLSPHSTNLGADYVQYHHPKPTLAPLNAHKRKIRDDNDYNQPQIVTDVHEVDGVSLSLHFPGPSGHDSLEEKSPDKVAEEIWISK